MQRTLRAAQLIDQLIRKVVVVDEGLHAESMVAAAARLAGTMMYRSFGIERPDLEPGARVLSEQANRDGPILVDALFDVLRQHGHDAIDDKAMDAVADRAAAPRFTLAENQTTLEPWYRKIMETSDLTFRDMALASVIATATLIHDCAEVLPVAAGSLVAVEGFVEGAKTVPQPCAEAAA